MALEKTAVVDKIEVLENGSVQVRTRTAILEDGEQIKRHIPPPCCRPRR